MDEKTKSAIEVCERIVNNAESMLEGREAINHVLTELKDLNEMLERAVGIDFGRLGNVEEMGGCWQHWDVANGYSESEYPSAIAAFKSLRADR